MKTFFDCIPCFIRQALDSARLATPDEAVQERVVREALRAGAEMDMRQTPPAMAQHIHRAIREFAGQGDPYREIKDWSNRMALTLYPTLRTWGRGLEQADGDGDQTRDCRQRDRLRRE